MRNLFSLPETHNLNPEVVKHLRRNILTNILDAGFWYFGDSFVAAYTILPVFMSNFNGFSPIDRGNSSIARRRLVLASIIFCQTSGESEQTIAHGAYPWNHRTAFLFTAGYSSPFYS